MLPNAVTYTSTEYISNCGILGFMLAAIGVGCAAVYRWPGITGGPGPGKKTLATGLVMFLAGSWFLGIALHRYHHSADTWRDEYATGLVATIEEHWAVTVVDIGPELSDANNVMIAFDGAARQCDIDNHTGAAGDRLGLTCGELELPLRTATSLTTGEAPAELTQELPKRTRDFNEEHSDNAFDSILVGVVSFFVWGMTLLVLSSRSEDEEASPLDALGRRGIAVGLALLALTIPSGKALALEYDHRADREAEAFKNLVQTQTEAHWDVDILALDGSPTRYTADVRISDHPNVEVCTITPQAGLHGNYIQLDCPKQNVPLRTPSTAT